MNGNYKRHTHDTLRKELNSGYTHQAQETLDSIKFKKQEKPQKTITEKLKLIKIKKKEVNQKS